MLPENLSNLLLPFQVPHVIEFGRIFDERDCIANTSDPGVGKTHISCCIAKWKNRRLFVLAPKISIPHWFATAERFKVDLIGISNYEAIKTGKYYENVEQYLADKRVECPFIEINVDENTPFRWSFPDHTLLIADEIHRGQHNTTATTQLILSAKTIFEDDAKMIILSATITDRIECFRTVASLLGLVQDYGKHAFVAWVKNIKKTYPGITIEEAIHKILYPKYGARLCIKQIKREMRLRNQEQIFLESNVRAEVYDVSPETEKEIAGAYNDINDALIALKNKEKTEQCYLTIMLRARQRIELLKVPVLAMEAMQHLVNDKSVCIFVNFNETIEQLFAIMDDFVHDEFKSFVTFIRGSQNSQERNYNQESFQNGRSRLIICNVQAGGESISLNDTIGTNARVVLISPPWSAIKLTQCLGRCYRANSKTDCTQIIVYCRGKVSNSSQNQSGVDKEIDTGGQIIQITGDIVRLAPTKDTTFNGENGEKIGVEELMAINLNKKLKTIEFLNNGDDADLTQL